MSGRILDRWWRFDARSLGLFRVLFGLVLIGDLLRRWEHLTTFYSNEGVVPNHYHLFQLLEPEAREGIGNIWSVFHAFSSEGENAFGFAVTLVAYVCFTVGWKTRAFHFVGLIALIGLCGRNVLTDGVGNHVAIALMLFTLFLPLGARFSLDALVASFSADDERAADEHTPRELNEGALPTKPVAPSLATLAVLLLLALIYASAGLAQRGETWQSGEALYYALHTDRWTGAAGVWVREHLPLGLLSAWTHVLPWLELGVAALIVVPALPRITRGLAIAGMVAHGLTFAVLFTLGPYAWSLLAAAALLVPAETWDRLETGHDRITVFYDDACGICLWLSRLLRRLDLRRQIVFAANSDLEGLPPGVTPERSQETIVVVDAAGKVYEEARAISEIIRRLPVLWPLAWLLRVPGLDQLTGRLYRSVARSRLDISVACGLGACGVPRAAAEQRLVDDRPVPSPARRLAGAVATIAVNALVMFLLLSVAARTEQANELPIASPLKHERALGELATWPQIRAQWGVFAPDPPRENATLVTVASTRANYEVDVLNGWPPDLELEHPARARLGQMWADYNARIQLPRFEPFHKELRRYLRRGGPAWDPGPDRTHQIRALDAFWVSVAIPPPGQPRAGEVARRALFSEGAIGNRGDRAASPIRKLPSLRRPPR